MVDFLALVPPVLLVVLLVVVVVFIIKSLIKFAIVVGALAFLVFLAWRMNWISF